jgi:hypothetical protein
MSREEISVGLNNAVARGESLEKAMQSMVLAGYNPVEIQEAAGMVNMGVIGALPKSPAQPSSGYQPLPTASSTGVLQEKPKKKSSMLMVILLSVVLLLLVGLGIFVFFGDSILNALFPK